MKGEVDEKARIGITLTFSDWSHNRAETEVQEFEFSTDQRTVNIRWKANQSGRQRSI
jgi:hypothetical protein